MRHLIIFTLFIFCFIQGQIEASCNFQYLAGGTGIAVASTSGLLFTWGVNSNNGSLIPAETPSPEPIDKASAGISHFLALSTTGNIFTWGSPPGSCGATIPSPVYLNSSNFGGKKISDITSGHHHNLVLTEDGVAYGWGLNSDGRVGDKTTTTRCSPVLVDATGVLQGKKLVRVSAGSGSVALGDDGSVYFWGNNNLSPITVNLSNLNGKTIKKMVAGGYHYLLLTNDGLVFGWGYNDQGQLGNGNTTAESAPTAIANNGITSGLTFIDIAASDAGSFVLSSAGNLFSFGEAAALGTSATTFSVTPVAVNASLVTSGTTIKAVFGTVRSWAAAIGSDNAGYAWGTGGQLGDGTTSSRSYLAKMTCPDTPNIPSPSPNPSPSPSPSPNPTPNPTPNPSSPSTRNIPIWIAVVVCLGLLFIQ